MAVKIRLDRTGTKNRPYYRVIIVDRRRSGGSRCIEIVGQYDPLFDKDNIKLDKNKILEWIKKGAQPTFTVRKLLGKAGVLEKLDTSKLKKKAPKEKGTGEQKEGEAKEQKKPAQPTGGEEKKPAAPAGEKAQEKAEVKKAEEPAK